MPRSKTNPYKPSIEEIFYREKLKEQLIKKELRPIKYKKYGRWKIECKAYTHMFIVMNWLDKKFKYWTKFTSNTSSYRKNILKNDLFMGSNFQKQIKQLHDTYTIINNTTTSILLKSIPLEIVLEELPIVTELNNIIVNSVNEISPKKELSIYDCTCYIPDITYYSSSVVLS
ncbi:hypothetical protein K6025_01915 [Ehrlichia sp. JZT12]